MTCLKHLTEGERFRVKGMDVTGTVESVRGSSVTVRLDTPRRTVTLRRLDGKVISFTPKQSRCTTFAARTEVERIPVEECAR